MQRHVPVSPFLAFLQYDAGDTTGQRYFHSRRPTGNRAGYTEPMSIYSLDISQVCNKNNI
jgi:hypothetical protein